MKWVAPEAPQPSQELCVFGGGGQMWEKAGLEQNCPVCVGGRGGPKKVGGREMGHRLVLSDG